MAQMKFVLTKIKLPNQHTDEAELLLTETLNLLNNDKLKAKDKKHMVLYVAIEKTLGIENPSQELINYLEKKIKIQIIKIQIILLKLIKSYTQRNYPPYLNISSCARELVRE